MVNKHLLHDLTEMGLWSPALKNRVIYEDGSVQKIPEIPEELKAIYKYVSTNMSQFRPCVHIWCSFWPYANSIWY